MNIAELIPELIALSDGLLKLISKLTGEAATAIDTIEGAAAPLAQSIGSAVSTVEQTAKVAAETVKTEAHAMSAAQQVAAGIPPANYTPPAAPLPPTVKP